MLGTKATTLSKATSQPYFLGYCAIYLTTPLRTDSRPHPTGHIGGRHPTTDEGRRPLPPGRRPAPNHHPACPRTVHATTGSLSPRTKRRSRTWLSRHIDTSLAQLHIIQTYKKWYRMTTEEAQPLMAFLDIQDIAHDKNWTQGTRIYKYLYRLIGFDKHRYITDRIYRWKPILLFEKVFGIGTLTLLPPWPR